MKIFIIVCLLAATVSCGTDKPFGRGEPKTSVGGSNPKSEGGNPVVSAAKDYFKAQVYPAMKQDCMKCHSGGGLAGFDISDDMDNSYASAMKNVLPGNPDGSKIYQKAQGNMGHGGGLRYKSGSQELSNLNAWIKSEVL
jgi:hypothetical protein